MSSPTPEPPRGDQFAASAQPEVWVAIRPRSTRHARCAECCTPVRDAKYAIEDGDTGFVRASGSCCCARWRSASRRDALKDTTLANTTLIWTR